MSVDQHQGPSPQQEKRFATLYELQSIKAFEALEKLATTDKLTGLYNKTFWETQRPKLEQSAHLAYVLVYLDLNYLKITNDQKGHQAGDILLKNAASILKKTFRPEDFIIREGGDEFIAILSVDYEKYQQEFEEFKKENGSPDLKMEDYASININHRLSTNIASFNDLHPENPVSISFGTQISTPENFPHDLMARFKEAEKKMYRMKANYHSSN